MKMQTYVIHIQKILKIIISKIKYCQVMDHFHYTEKYRGATHSICDLKYATLKAFQ